MVKKTNLNSSKLLNNLMLKDKTKKKIKKKRTPFNLG